MNKNIFSGLSVFLVALVALAGTAFADSSDVAALNEKVDILNKKIAALEKRVEKGSGVAVPTYVAAPGEESGGLLRAAQDIQMGGHLDIQWNNNFRQPRTVAGTNIGRIFDTDDGSFTVNNATIYLENRAEEPGEAGFHVALSFGEDTGIIVGDGLAGDNVDLQKAYVEYIAPLPWFEDSEILPDSITLTAGRFATLAGMEVIEGADNWNISRSYMFGLAIPFLHTGVRSNFQLFNDFLDVYFGVNNGWDLAVDNNSWKTMEVAVGYSPIENVDMFHAFYWGSENPDNPNGKTWLVTNVITYQLTDKITLAGDADFAHVGKDNGVVAQSGDWWGLAGYIRYQINDKAALSYRAEMFADEEGVRTGGLGLAGFTVVSDRMFEQTVTAEYKLTEQLIARAEFRHDKANENRPFDAGQESAQTSIGAQLLYLI